MIKKIKNRLLRSFSPIMVGKLRASNGIIIPSTRVSNTTFIEAPDKLNLGKNVFIGHYNYIDASKGLTIEDGCQITNYISILTHSSHISIRLYGYHYINETNPLGYKTGEVFIGKFTFIGPHSVIMPGSKIGKGSIISAFSYVKGEFPDFAIIAGNPAKVVGDTRRIDQPFLDNYPELKAFYQDWLNENKK